MAMSVRLIEYLLYSGSLGDLGNKAILENVIDHTHRFYPKFLSYLWKEPCDEIKLVYMGFMLLGYELPLPLSN
jgi:hypothetical protein